MFLIHSISHLIPAITERGVHVRLMLSERAYTYKHRKEHLQSLLELNKDVGKKLVQIKVFHVRTFHK